MAPAAALLLRGINDQLPAFEAHAAESVDQVPGVLLADIEERGTRHHADGTERLARQRGFIQQEADDIRGADVLAFQRLWNRNAPDDQISEDGVYGAMTEDRIKRAPAEGFGIGAICGTSGRVVMHNIPDTSDRSLECAD